MSILNVKEIYIEVAQIDLWSNDYLLKQVFRSRKLHRLIYKCKPLSYTATRETILGRLRLVCGSIDVGFQSSARF